MVSVRWRKAGELEWSHKQWPDSELQRVLDRAHAAFGAPGAVLDIPDKLPEPKVLLLTKRRR